MNGLVTRPRVRDGETGEETGGETGHHQAEHLLSALSLLLRQRPDHRLQHLLLLQVRAPSDDRPFFEDDDACDSTPPSTPESLRRRHPVQQNPTPCLTTGPSETRPGHGWAALAHTRSRSRHQLTIDWNGKRKRKEQAHAERVGQDRDCDQESEDMREEGDGWCGWTERRTGHRERADGRVASGRWQQEWKQQQE